MVEDGLFNVSKCWNNVAGLAACVIHVEYVRNISSYSPQLLEKPCLPRFYPCLVIKRYFYQNWDQVLLFILLKVRDADCFCPRSGRRSDVQ